MDPDEIAAVMQEWQGSTVGALTFDNFLSMMCVYLKREGVEEQMELDFLKFVGIYKMDGKGLGEIDEICEALDTKKESLVVTAEGIMAVYQHMRLPINLATAQDMVFDAGEEADDYITIDEFNRLVTLVSRNELILDGERALRQSKLRRMRDASNSRDEAPADATPIPSNTGPEIPAHRYGSLSRHGSPATLRRYASNLRRRHKSRNCSHHETPQVRDSGEITRSNSIKREPAPTAPTSPVREAVV